MIAVADWVFAVFTAGAFIVGILIGFALRHFFVRIGGGSLTFERDPMAPGTARKAQRPSQGAPEASDGTSEPGTGVA